MCVSTRTSPAVAVLAAMRLHKNVARGGGAARGPQSTRAYCGSERIAEPRRRRIGAAGRAALAERMEWTGIGGRGVWGILLASWPKGG